MHQITGNPTDSLPPTRLDTVAIAKRVNAGVAVELRSQRLRESYARDTYAAPHNCDCERVIEQIIAAIAAVSIRLDNVEVTADYAAEVAESARDLSS